MNNKFLPANFSVSIRHQQSSLQEGEAGEGGVGLVESGLLGVGREELPSNPGGGSLLQPDCLHMAMDSVRGICCCLCCLVAAKALCLHTCLSST